MDMKTCSASKKFLPFSEVSRKLTRILELLCSQSTVPPITTHWDFYVLSHSLLWCCWPSMAQASTSPIFALVIIKELKEMYLHMPRFTEIQWLCITGRDRDTREMLRTKLLGSHSNTEAGSDLRIHLFRTGHHSINMKSRPREKKKMVVTCWWIRLYQK